MRSRTSGVASQIRREARVVGLRDFDAPSLEAVEARRMQLWIVTSVLLVVVSAGLALLSFLPGRSGWLSPRGLRWAVVLLSLAFCVYAVEKEVHLQRLSRLLVDERVLTTALSNRLHEVSLLLESGKAMNAVLELGAVLEVILASASELLCARSGSIMLIEGDELVGACVRDNEHARGRRVRIGEGIAGRVAVAREPLLINGEASPEEFPGLVRRVEPVDSAMCVPLVHRDGLLGVLSVNAEQDRSFTEYDLRAVSLFAEQAAAAIANARLYEAERSHVAELIELDRMKSEFVERVSHELRTPLTALVAAAGAARNPEMHGQLQELLPMIERNAKHLAGMIEDLLAEAELERRRGPIRALGAVDLAALVRLVARDYEISGREVTVEAPGSALVLGNTDALRRILDNLVDNAHKYGRPPVRVSVEAQEERSILSVLDSGPGIPPADRERVFERFSRLGTSKGKPGLGLGLPITRALVTSCAGSIWIEDAPGGGAAFRVALLLRASAREAV